MSHKVLQRHMTKHLYHPLEVQFQLEVHHRNFVDRGTSMWDQSYLAKAMLQMKDSEVSKLRFSDTCYKPYEYEKWLCGVTRVMIAIHPEMGAYWNRIVAAAEKTYHKYVNYVRTSRVSLRPKKEIHRSDIELKIENEIRTL